MLSLVSCLASFKALWEAGSQLACGLEQGPAQGVGMVSPVLCRLGTAGRLQAVGGE